MVQQAGDWAMRHLNSPVPTRLKPSGWHLVCAGPGSVAMMLIFIKSRFVWWPIHPVGMAVGLTAPTRLAAQVGHTQVGRHK